MTLALAFALAAALTWGTGDYLAKLSAERFGFWPTMLGINMSSTLLLVLPAWMGYIPSVRCGTGACSRCWRF